MIMVNKQRYVTGRRRGQVVRVRISVGPIIVFSIKLVLEKNENK